MCNDIFQDSPFIIIKKGNKDKNVSQLDKLKCNAMAFTAEHMML